MGKGGGNSNTYKYICKGAVNEECVSLLIISIIII